MTRSPASPLLGLASDATLDSTGTPAKDLLLQLQTQDTRTPASPDVSSQNVPPLPLAQHVILRHPIGESRTVPLSTKPQSCTSSK